MPVAAFPARRGTEVLDVGACAAHERACLCRGCAMPVLLWWRACARLGGAGEEWLGRHVILSFKARRRQQPSALSLVGARRGARPSTRMCDGRRCMRVFAACTRRVLYSNRARACVASAQEQRAVCVRAGGICSTPPCLESGERACRVLPVIMLAERGVVALVPCLCECWLAWRCVEERCVPGCASRSAGHARAGLLLCLCVFGRPGQAHSAGAA